MVSIALVLTLSGCSAESKAAPFLRQICSDWSTKDFYLSNSVALRNMTSNFSLQVDAAVALDPEASAEFQVGVNLLKNLVVLDRQIAEYYAESWYAKVYEKNFLLSESAERAADALSLRFEAENVKVIANFAEICKDYE
jgi:hypothetical protein